MHLWQGSALDPDEEKGKRKMEGKERDKTPQNKLLVTASAQDLVVK